MRGNKYDYKIKYDDISRLFLLPKPDDVHMAFVIALDKPIRQGQQRYQHLVLQTSKDPDEITVNLDEETLKKEYGDDLQPVMRGSLSNLVAKTFKVIAKKKVFIPGKFSNANQQCCVKCALRANEGLLYPLEKQFVFIHKPPVLIRFNEVESVEFQRYAGGQGSTRNFDLCVTIKNSVPGGQSEYTFSGIDRSDYTGLYNFLSGKNIRIKNLQEQQVELTATAPVYNEDEIYGGPDDGMEEESDDESYDANAKDDDDDGDSSGSEDIDDDEMGSEIDEDLDSDLDEHRSGSKKKKKRDGDDGDLIEDDLPKKKKKKTSKKGDSPSKKPKKDPNAPKRNQSSFMFYSNAVRPNVKEDNPDASFGDIVSRLGLKNFGVFETLTFVTAQGRIIGAQFKALSEDEKAKYVAMAEKDKERYNKEMEDYIPPEGMEGESKGKAMKGSKKAKKDPNAPKRNQSSFMFYSNAVRPSVKEANPEATFGEIVSLFRYSILSNCALPISHSGTTQGKLIGAQFNELSETEKQKYVDMAEKDKARYKEEMKKYEAKKKVGNDSDGMDDHGSDDSDSDLD